MYMARKNIYDKLEDQYAKLWNYCETLRLTNKGSCVSMKVDRPNPSVSLKFQRLYIFLVVMKKGFLEACRPVIEVDVCFLKGLFKG